MTTSPDCLTSLTLCILDDAWAESDDNGSFGTIEGKSKYVRNLSSINEQPSDSFYIPTERFDLPNLCLGANWSDGPPVFEFSYQPY
jgi:hypothetical protein